MNLRITHNSPRINLRDKFNAPNYKWVVSEKNTSYTTWGES
jgi:hypothetical protein